MLDLALQPDGASQERSQYQAQQVNPGRRHFAHQDFVDTLHEWHGSLGGWILSPENLVPGGFRARKLTQMITGTGRVSGRSSPWADPKHGSPPAASDFAFGTAVETASPSKAMTNSAYCDGLASARSHNPSRSTGCFQVRWLPSLITRRNGMPACCNAPTCSPRYMSRVESLGSAFRKSASSRSTAMRPRELTVASPRQTGADQIEP